MIMAGQSKKKKLKHKKYVYYVCMKLLHNSLNTLDENCIHVVQH